MRMSLHLFPLLQTACFGNVHQGILRERSLVFQRTDCRSFQQVFIVSLLCAVIWAPLPCLSSQTDIISFNKTLQYVPMISQQGELREL